MDVVGLVALCAVGSALGYLAQPFFTSRKRQLKRELRRAARRTLAELPEGMLGRVVGRAEPFDDTLEAPLSGRRCVYYTAIVQVAEGRFWKDVYREDRAVVFVLDDGTARAIVDPSRSKVLLDFDANTTSGTFDNPNEHERAFLDAHRISSTHVGGLLNRSLRYTEATIEVGETIAIFGATTREPDPDALPEAAYRGDAPTQLRMTSSRKQPMIITDSASATRD